MRFDGDVPYLGSRLLRGPAADRVHVYAGAPGPCSRCEVVCTDQASGERGAGAEPLLTLAAFRRRGGRINFGILLSRAAHDREAATGRGTEPGMDAPEEHVAHLLSIGMPVMECRDA